MNLLYTLTAYPPSVGGAQIHMHALAQQLRAAGHHLQVVAHWDARRTDWLLGTTLRAPREPRSYEIDGIPVQLIALPDAARRRLWPWVLAYYALQSQALERIAVALAEQFAGLAARVDLIHNCRIGREGLSYASLQVARRRGIPFVLTPVHHPRWGGWLHRHYQHLYRQADALIALTEAEKQQLVDLGADEQRVHVTGIGPVLADSADGERFRQSHQLADFPLVLFLGQKYPYKGFAQLLEAAPHVWRRHPDVRFVFAGPRTAHSRKLFANVGDRRILELDAVNLQEKTDALAACDIFCLPSSQESFGGVFTEAWTLGKPVIGCDIPAVRAVIEDGQDGLLSEQTPVSLAEKIVYLLDRPEERQRLGQRGGAKAQARYAWPRLAEMTLDVYRRIL